MTKKTKPKETKLEVMERLGLIGCLNDTDVTSENYKEKILESFEASHKNGKKVK